jgi:hemolysin III
MRDAAGTAGETGGVGCAGAVGGGHRADAAAPRLRGVLHAGAFPFTAVAGVVLVAFAPSRPARTAAAVYGVACMALFGFSAAYHRSPAGSRRRPPAVPARPRGHPDW